MRRQVKAVDREGKKFCYALSCEHKIVGDFRHVRHGQRLQPKTALCFDCPPRAHPAPIGA